MDVSDYSTAGSGGLGLDYIGLRKLSPTLVPEIELNHLGRYSILKDFANSFLQSDLRLTSVLFSDTP